jgi:hypothetical protein
MELTNEQIEKINKDCQEGQGVFKEPFGIPNHIKGLVVYTKWESGGCDASCDDDEYTVNEPYISNRPKDCFDVLDKVIKVLCPEKTISYSDLNKIKSLIDSNEETDYGYYGDYTEETIEWILLDDLIDALNKN